MRHSFVKNKSVALKVGQDRKALMDKCASLSPREKEVLQRLGLRQRAKEIARELNISEHTVRGYANEARQKLGLTSTRDAALIFSEFEKENSPPQNRGDQNQRVSEHLLSRPSSDGGFSIPFPNGRDQASTSGADAEGKQLPSEKAIPESGRLVQLHTWLASLNLARWLGVIVLLTLGVILAFGAAAVALWGVFEVLHQIGSQHR